MRAKRNKIINQMEKEIPPPFLFFPFEEFGEIVSMPVGIFRQPRRWDGWGSNCAQSCDYHYEN
jgi:hypothetical protein